MKKHAVIALASVLATTPLSHAQDHQPMHEHHTEPVATNEPPIEITINPEARVSVALVGPLPPPVTCGMALEFPVRIINQGLVTSRLEAELIGRDPGSIALDFHPEPLTGAPEEQRDLRITVTKPGATDVTLSFRTHYNAPDLGGRDRIHFLVKCTARH